MRTSCTSVGVVCLLFFLQWSLADQESTPTTVQQDWVITPCDCECGQFKGIDRIVEGMEAKPHEFPWIVYITRDNRQLHCGGVLITPRHVLTAAHCTNMVTKEMLTVTIGGHHRHMHSRYQQTRRVIKMTPHPGFTMVNYHDDIAVLELDRPVILTSTIRIACLPDSDGKVYTGMKGVVAGWGRTSEEKPSSLYLQKVSVPIMSSTQCRSLGYLADRITDNMLCAGYRYGGRDSCQGDSGGPMNAVVDGVVEVIGIVSWGKGCARPFYPGVYTRVSRYLGWIDQNIDGECRCSRSIF